MIERIPNRKYGAAIAHALGFIPDRIMHRLAGVRIFAGSDPIFAGLHGFENISDGRSYRHTAHCCYPWHFDRPRADRVTTIVLPCERATRPAVVVHEMGHALHHAVDLDYEAVPVSDYGATNHREAFAEAFAAWVLPLGHGYGAAKDRLYAMDRETVALLDGLAA